MATNFKITGISEGTYEHLFKLDENELRELGGQLMIVDQKPGYPCRVSLEDAEIGEEVVLFPFKHHNTSSPYQANGPIFIRRNARQSQLENNEIPMMLVHRLLSLRVYNAQGIMIEAETIEGRELRSRIAAIFGNQEADYIHVHNAGPGCYNCQINKVS